MPVLSDKDKMRLRVSKARVEAWKRHMETPASNPVDRKGDLKQIRFRVTLGVNKRDDEVIVPDNTEAICRSSDGYAVRSMSGKLALHVKAQGVPDNGRYIEEPFDVRMARAYDAAAQGPKHVTKRADSPFKRAKRETVIVRK